MRGLRPQPWDRLLAALSPVDLAARQAAFACIPGVVIDEAFMAGCGQLGGAAPAADPAPAAGRAGDAARGRH